jgi:formate dehydrogenase major subunit
MYDSDCIVVMGSNMAENHPVAFRWPMKAKVEHGAKIIHIDPRFTRTSAVADIYAPVRAGSDIAFLGGVINYVINSERWNKDPFFKTFVVNYTNAATLLREDFQDTEDLDGVFSGLETAKGGGVRVQDFPVEGVAEWPFNGFINQYHRASWEYAREKPPAVSAKPVELKPGEGFAPLVASLVWPPPLKDETLQNPRCVFQTVKRHFARYTPEMVEKTTGCPKETFLKVAETILANSGAERTTSFAYAVAWTQHTYGVQIIGACALRNFCSATSAPRLPVCGGAAATPRFRDRQIFRRSTIPSRGI